MKTILYIWRSMASLAGVERVLSMKINWLASHGYKVILVTYEQCHHPIVFSFHPNVKIVDLKTPFFQLSKYSLYLRYFKYLRMKEVFSCRLKEIVNDVHPDVVLTIAGSMNVLKEIYNACKGTKLIIESHESFSSVMKEPAYSHHPILSMVAKLYDKQNLKYVNRFNNVITLTKGDADEWKKHILTKIDIIPNLLDIPFYINRREETYHRIIAAGRLEEIKGFDRLIKAFSMIEKKCPQWKVDIYGNGSCKESLQAMINNYHLENRVFLQSPTSQLFNEYQQSDFCVLSSHHEGFGMVMLEAMSCETPCVAFRCKYGPEEIIEHPKTGLLVKNGDVQELANAILWMIEHPAERSAMGKAAREAAKRYDKDKIMKKWEKLFSS